MKKSVALLMILLIMTLSIAMFPGFGASQELPVQIFFQNKSGITVTMWIGHFAVKELNARNAITLGPDGHALYNVTMKYDKKNDEGYAYVNDKVFASMVQASLTELGANSSTLNVSSGRFAVKGYLNAITIIFDGKEFYAKITYRDGTEEQKRISTAGQTDTKEALPAAGVMVTLIPAGLLGALALAGKKRKDTPSKKDDTYYYLAISKDFGDKVRCDAESVTISAAIVEVTTDAHGDKSEKIIEALSENIEISAKESFVETSEPVMIDGEKVINFMVHSNDKGLPPADTFTLTFNFKNHLGYLTQNIIFKVVGKPYIEVEAEKLYVLAASGDTYDLHYNLMDFVDEAKVEVNCFQSETPFYLELAKTDDDATVIKALDQWQPKPFESFYTSYTCEIIAQNEKEYARTIFNVVMCHEGIGPDFLGREPEIVAYKNQEGEMPLTHIAFRLGLWDAHEKKLNLSKPSEVDIRFTDEKGIFEVIGLTYEVDDSSSTNDYLMYAFKAEKSLPNTSPVPGNLIAYYQTDLITLESTTSVRLMPDLLSYENDLALEYKKCVRIIETYLPAEFSVRKLKELEANRDKMGIKDLQLFRKNCWEIASRFIMQEHESYMIDSYYYDEQIATAELLVYIGDVALDVALAPFGGPIAGFVITQVKAALMELVAMRIEKGGIGYNEIYSLIMKRFEQAAGQADGLIETPGFDKPKALVAWLTTYILYRIMYRWYFDVDENNNPKGLAEAITNGLMDFAGKGASILLGEFAKDIAGKRGINHDSTAGAEQKWVNDNVEKASKAGLDAMDKAAGALDQKIDEIVATILEYVERIRKGATS